MNRPLIPILLVSELPADAELLQEILARTEIELAIATSLGEALQLLGEGLNLQAVLLVLSLSDVSGLAAVAELLGAAPDLPIVAIANGSDVGDGDERALEVLALESIRAGAQEFLVKARLDRATLCRAIRLAIERASQTGALRQEADATKKSVFQTEEGQKILASTMPEIADITSDRARDIVRVEDLLEKSEQRLRALLENSADVTAILGTDGSVRYISPSVEKILGYPAAESIGKICFNLLHPEDAPLAIAWMEGALQSPGAQEKSGDYRLRHRDGSWRYFTAVAINLLDDPAVQGVVVNAHDITERKEVEATYARLIASVRESEERFRTLVANIPGLVYRCQYDADWTMEFISQASLEITGYPASAFIQNKELTFASIIHPEDTEKVDAAVGEAVAAKRPYIIEYRIIRADGKIAWFHEKGQAIFSPDRTEVQYLDGVVLDITEQLQIQERLRRSEAKLQNIAANLPGMIYQFQLLPDGSMKFPYVSDRCRDLFRLEPEELEANAQLAFDQVHPDDRPVFDKALVISAKTLKPWLWEGRIINPGGEMKWIRGESRVQKSAAGEITWNGAIVDISDRKQAEKALRQSEAINRSLLNAIPDMMFCYSSDGTYLDFKPSKQTKPLLPPEYFLGKKVNEVMPPEIAEPIMHGIEEAIATGETQPIEYELQLDGKRIYYEGRLVVIGENEVMAIVRDMTERKTAEIALRKSEQRWQLAVRGSNDGIWDWNIETNEVFFSARWKEMLGYRDDEIRHNFEEWESRVHPEDLDWVMAAIRAHLAERSPFFRAEYRMQHEDGTYRWILARGQGFWDEAGNPVRMAGSHSDITERKQAEEELQRSRAKLQDNNQQLELALSELRRTQAQLVQNEKMFGLGQLVAGVAHEINNPVSFIYGNIDPARDYAENLLELIGLYQQHYPQPAPEIEAELEAMEIDFLAEDFPKLLVSMKQGANRIKQIVESLRNFSRLDEAEKKDVDIRAGIDSTLLMLQHRLRSVAKESSAGAGDGGIEVIKEYGTMPQVECFPGQLNQVFMNILNNAIDILANQPSPRRIAIRTEVENGEFAIVRIADNGPGMSEEVRQRLFDPFFTTKTVGKGTGLGLSISYQIVVEKHGGELSCVSAPRQGAEFIISIPIRGKITDAIAPDGKKIKELH